MESERETMRVDARYTRKTSETRTRIFDALYYMLEENPDLKLDKVKVADICARANITRTAFYYHFSDKYDVVGSFLQIMGERAFTRVGIDMNYAEAVQTWIMSLEPYKTFLVRCLQSKYYVEIHTRLIETLKSSYMAAAVPEGEDALENQTEFDIEYFSVALEAIITDWASGKINASPKRLTRYIMNFMPPELVARVATNVYDDPASA